MRADLLQYAYKTIIAVGRRGNGARFLWSLQRLNLSGKWGEAACVADIFACYFAYGHRSQYSCGIDKMYLFKRVRKDTATHADKPHFYDSAKNMDKIVFLCYYVNRNCEVEDYGCHKLYR